MLIFEHNFWMKNSPCINRVKIVCLIMLMVDISNYMEKKMKIIECYSSQFFNPKSKEPETVISKKSFLENLLFGIF